MTSKTAENLIEICDIIASGTLSYSAACRMAGVSTRSFWRWIKASQSGDEDFLIEYLGEQLQFAKAVNVARRIAQYEMRGRMEEKSIFGYDEKVFYMGQPTWKPDPHCVGVDEDIRELLGLPRDGLLRDVNGACIQNVIHHEPPVALQLRVAEMAFPKEYRPGTTSDINVTGGLAVGVARVKLPDYSKPPVIPPAPPLPELEVMADGTADFTGVEADEEAEANEVPEAVPPKLALVIGPTRAEPERVITDAPPTEWQPPQQGILAPTTNAERSGRPLTPLEMDLLRRSRATPEERSKPIGGIDDR